MTDWAATFKYAIRGLLRQPTFALVAIVTLALGIGANTAIFSVIKTVVLNPLPYESPEQIAIVWEVNPDGNQGPVSVPTYEDWKRDAKAFDSLAAYRHVDFSFQGTGDPQNVPGLKATPELFGVLKSNAALGRTFTADEAVVGADRVVVLSHGFWTRALAGDQAIIGRSIQLDSVPYTVVGVMPSSFEFPTSTNVEVWTPLAFDPKDMHGRSRRARSLTVVGRLRAADQSTSENATVGLAQRELDVISARISSEFKDSNAGWNARVIAAHDQLVGASRPALMVLMGAVGFLLLIVCANMANLLLARLSSRRREMAVRGAIGASKWEVARPVIAESLLLSLIGGVLGLVLANIGLRMLGTMEEARLPRMDSLQLDGGVLLFTMIVSIGVALAFGLIPALHASRQELRDVMHESSGSTGSPYARRVLSALVVVEVALALVLLVGAGLMTRSFTKLLQVSPGFEPSNLIAARVLLPATKYQRGNQVRFYEDVIERVRREPGVTNASAVSAMPLHDVGAAGALPFNVEGQQPPPTEDPLADVRIVAPGYFETMKIKLIAGRFLDDRDAEVAPRTSVINETMARRYFPNESPLGRIIQNPHGKSEVVGVVGDVHNQGLDREPRKQVYLPMKQSPTAGMALVARTDRDAATFANAITRAIWEVDPGQPVYELSTMDQILARAVFLPRLSTTLLAMFALAALLLAALGIYGVLSYSVSQRTKEIGLRMALGASGGNTVAMIVRSSVGMVAIGGVIGLIAATLLARSMAGILYGVGPFDLPAFTLAMLTLLIAGVVASVLPALRTTRVDPVVALRDQ